LRRSSLFATTVLRLIAQAFDFFKSEAFMVIARAFASDDTNLSAAV
jgi:hypothetical protein